MSDGRPSDAVHPRRTPVFQAAAVALAVAALLPSTRAQFRDTEVSPAGSVPFRLSRAAPATWEDLGAGVSYNVHRREPGGPLARLAGDLPVNGWAGDSEDPGPRRAFWYVVNGFDGVEENRHGSVVPISVPCHPAPLPSWCSPGFVPWEPGVDGPHVLVGPGGWLDPSHVVRTAGNRNAVVAAAGRGRIYPAWGNLLSSSPYSEDHCVTTCDDVARTCAPPTCVNNYARQAGSSHSRPGVLGPPAPGTPLLFFGTEGADHLRAISSAPFSTAAFEAPLPTEHFQACETHGFVLPTQELVWAGTCVATRVVLYSGDGTHLWTREVLAGAGTPPRPPECTPVFDGVFSKGQLSVVPHADGGVTGILTWGWTFGVSGACPDANLDMGSDMHQVFCATTRDFATWTSCRDPSVSATPRACASAIACFYSVSTYPVTGPNLTGIADCGSDCGELRGFAFTPGAPGVLEFVVDDGVSYDRVPAALWDPASGDFLVWAARTVGGVHEIAGHPLRSWAPPVRLGMPGRCHGTAFHPCFPGTALVGCGGSGTDVYSYVRRTVAGR